MERPHWTRRRLIGVTLGVALILSVFTAGLVFANAVSASRVADNAAALHWTNSALGTSALARAALVQAATFVELEEVGLVPASDTETAMDEVGEARDRLRDLIRSGVGAGSSDELAAFATDVDKVVAALEGKDHKAAEARLVGGLESRYRDLVEAIGYEQVVIQGRIDANTAGAARVTDFMRFFLTLGIPASAILVYRSIAKRQVRELRLKTQLELEKERAIGRAKDEFVAGLSHELKTPLTSIYGFAEVLANGGTDDPTGASEMAGIIANEAAEMKRMVDDLLAAARLDSTGLEVERREVHLDDVIESALGPFTRAGVSVHWAPSDLTVETDPARLRHVVVNLISNARRHGGPGIGIETSVGKGRVEIEIWDDGPGVPADRAESLFDTFIHNGRATLMTGTFGLGLGVASRITQLLGGCLRYQRLAGKSCFIVSLPHAEAEDAVWGEDGELSAPADDAPVPEMIRAMSA